MSYCLIAGYPAETICRSVNTCWLDAYLPLGLDAGGAPPHTIYVASAFFQTRLIEALRKNPSDLHTLDRRAFEELVAEVWDGLGFDVELTKRTRDGGIDVIAIQNQLVRSRYLIQCKRPDAGNKVSVTTVKELMGTLVDDPATKGIVATTSCFTKDAKELIDRHPWRLDGHDHDELLKHIDLYLAAKKGA